MTVRRSAGVGREQRGVRPPRLGSMAKRIGFAVFLTRMSFWSRTTHAAPHLNAY